MAIVGILSKVIDFGLGPIVFRESSREDENHKILNSALSIRLALFFIVLVIFDIVIYFLQFTLQEFILLNVLFLSVIFSTRMANIRELLTTPFKVHLKMHYPMTLTILDNFLFLIAVILMPLFNGGIYYFVFAYVFTTLPGFIIQFIFLEKKFQFRPKIIFYKTFWLLKEAFPLAGFVLLAIVYQQFDIVLLTKLKDEYSAGIYSVATRLTMPLNIIPSVIVTTVFPFLVKNLQDRFKTDSINAMVYKVLFLISFILALVFSFKSESIVQIIFGYKYSSAHLPTTLIFWSLVFMFFNYFTLDLLTAHSKQKLNFVYSLILVLSNTILNLILIPDYSFVGVGFAKIIAGFLGFIFLTWTLLKHDFSLSFINVKFILWIIITSVLVYLFSFLPLLLYLISASIIILITIILFKFFEKEEWEVIFRLLNKEKWGKYFQR